MSVEDNRGSGTYLIVYPERRQSERKFPVEEFPALLEQKPSPRKNLPFEMRAQVLGEVECECTLIDISLSGVRIKSKVNLVPGREIGLYFLVPTVQGNRQVPINPSCQVVWNQPESTQKNRAYLAGLKLITTTMTATQFEVYKEFVQSLSDSQKAHT